MIPLALFGAMLIAGTSAATYFGLRSDSEGLGKAFGAYEARIERHTSFLLLRWSGAQVARGQIGVFLASAAALAVTRHVAFAASAVLVALVPPTLLWSKHRARVDRLERQLDTWLLILANALRSTPSLGDAITSTASLVPAPFREEVDFLVKELRFGMPLDRALEGLARRCGSVVISGAVMIIVVARRTGGNLPATLEGAASTLREAARLEGVLRSKTAEGRGQVLVLALVPFVLVFVIASLDRSWFDPMVLSTHGRVILLGCAVAWLVATSWAHQIAGKQL